MQQQFNNIKLQLNSKIQTSANKTSAELENLHETITSLKKEKDELDFKLEISTTEFQIKAKEAKKYRKKAKKNEAIIKEQAALLEEDSKTKQDAVINLRNSISEKN